jgi:hypothetical protein
MSLETTIARGVARDAEQEWQQHRKACPWCQPVARKRRYDLLCLDGASLRRERDETRAEAAHQAEMDKQPIPGQEVLFGEAAA